MNDAYASSTAEWAQRDAAANPLDSALGEMSEQFDSLEKAASILKDRLGSVLQPEESTDLMTVPADKAGIPRSPALRRIEEHADDLCRLRRRIEGITARLDT